jgi:hypothetical protein
MRLPSATVGPSRYLGTLVFLVVVTLTVARPCAAQVLVGAGQDEPKPATDEFKSAAVDSISWAFNKTYIFEDVAKDVEKRLHQKLKKGDYDDLSTIQDFARQLTQDIQDVSHDLHTGVRFIDDTGVQEILQGDDDPELAQQRELERARKRNFGFKKLEVLDGNVGYIKFNEFQDASLAGPTLVAAMNFLGYTDALIVDLRDNGGGSPSFIQTMMAYLLDEPTHLNSFYIREGDSLQQFWSAPYVPGPSMKDVELYVLTSPGTFSAAEEFTYNIKNLGRGTIVGQRTGGGAHPVRAYMFDGMNLLVRVPYGRAINPISGTNWEGTGITPDIEVPIDQALDAAYLDALRKLRERGGAEDEMFGLDWAIAGLDAKLNPIDLPVEVLEEYAGDYGPRHLRVEGGRLVYWRDDREPAPATPMTETLFWFESIPYFRLEVVLGPDGQPVKLVGHYDNGYTDENPRDE